MNLPDGWFPEDDIAVYRILYESLPMSVQTVELGCWLGRSLCSVADIIKKKDISATVVDTFQGTQTEGEKHFFTQFSHRNILEEFKNNVAAFDLHPRILAMTTVEGSRYVPDDSLDLCLIDADHSYEAVKEDISMWLPKLKSGGVLLGDDYTRESVNTAVDELLHGIEAQASLWIYRKP